MHDLRWAYYLSFLINKHSFNFLFHRSERLIGGLVKTYTLGFKQGFGNVFSTQKHPILPHQRPQANQILNFSGENLFGWYL